MELWHDYTFYSFIFLNSEKNEPGRAAAIIGACLYSNPPLLLPLLVFLIPLLVATLLSSPLYFLAKTQGRRVRVTLRSLQCDTPHTGHGREEFRSGPLFICDE